MEVNTLLQQLNRLPHIHVTERASVCVEIVLLIKILPNFDEECANANKFPSLDKSSKSTAEDWEMDGKCLSPSLIATCTKAIHQYLSSFGADASLDPPSIRRRLMKRTYNAREAVEGNRFARFKQKLVVKGKDLKLW